MSKLALKRLSASDLSFFASHHKKDNKTSQKSINLNVSVFVKSLYPEFPRICKEADGNRIGVSVVLYGPGVSAAHVIPEKKYINRAAKNWRLNAWVANSEENSARFSVLKDGDYAVLSFSGDIVPTGVDIMFVSRSVQADVALYEELSRILGARSMMPLAQDELSEACEKAEILETHPARRFLFDKQLEEALEDAAYGAAEGASVVRRVRGLRKISAADLEKARSNAERIGREGEELVYVHLQKCVQARMISGFSWISKINATAPHDFEITELSGQRALVDAKSTEGDFQRSIHISAAELGEAAESDVPYSIYRIYQMNEEGGLLRVAQDIREFARQLQGWIAQLPQGIAPDGFTLSPGTLEWETEVSVHRLHDGEGEG